AERCDGAISQSECCHGCPGNRGNKLWLSFICIIWRRIREIVIFRRSEMQEGRGPVADRSTGRAPVRWENSTTPSHDHLQSDPPAAGLTWHGYLIQLLHIASSIEHALMVQYLYAAYSLDDERRNPREQAKVALWQNLILSIVKEEMGHIITVQTGLSLLSG